MDEGNSLILEYNAVGLENLTEFYSVAVARQKNRQKNGGKVRSGEAERFGG